MNLQKKLSEIRLLLLDADGVLTDGGIYYPADGREIKRFHVKDGFGIRLLMESGIRVGIVTGRVSEALRQRCENLGIDLIFDGVKEKGPLLETILAETDCKVGQIAFMGDDLPDIPLMQRVTLSVATADAHEAVRKAADMVCSCPGGGGAVRELCESILKARGEWDNILRKYTEGT
ncbi:MAG: HAD-IIIA family hydrolase [Desulfococcaceae bacterium]|jgi:3-deoxy-D-manno-octulosonate 8-phosphate phosphatase (KDO 8-P phosphatase)|nr:HAD-IIIA family hydrolase [Desulfococcaceae bacterium]